VKNIRGDSDVAYTGNRSNWDRTTKQRGTSGISCGWADDCKAFQFGYSQNDHSGKGEIISGLLSFSQHSLRWRAIAK
jgi:hypothetical protein